MTRVAILDTKHFEVTYTLICLFERQDIHITIFTHAEAYEQLVFLLGKRTVNFSWVIKDKNETNRRFIKRIFEETKKNSFEIIYINTIADNFILYAYHLKKLKAYRIIMSLHDINGYFKYVPSFSFRRIIRYWGKRKLIKIVTEFNVLSKTLADHLRIKLPENKQIFSIPGSFFDPASFIGRNHLEGEVIQIIIPGSVDSRRRNYDAIFELLERAEQLHLNISITLLGGFSENHSAKIKNQCFDFCKKANNLFFYGEEIVPQSEFDDKMRQSHFIWMPLQPSVIINDGVEEKYGVSICSGNIGDIIKYAKPFFAPSHLPLDSPLDEAACKYANVDDIITIIKNLSFKQYSIMQEKTLEVLSHYTKENIISMNTSLFL